MPSNIADDIKSELDSAIANAIANCSENYAQPFVRNRILSMEKMVYCLLSFRGGSVAKELHELGISVTPSAFVQRRRKLSSEMFEEILHYFNAKCDDPELFHGYRVMAVDGTAINLARDPKAASFIQNASNPKGYNQIHACCIYDVLNKTYHSCTINSDEIGGLLYSLAWYAFDKNTLIVADRGYESYNLFATIMESGLSFLIRVKQDRSAMREIAKLPMKELDTTISFTITTTQKREDKEKGYILVQTRKNKDRLYSPNTRAGRWDFPSPYPMSFRVVRVLLDTGEYETLATNLPSNITAEQIKELYHARWGIETAFRELKYSIGLVNLHGKSEEYARQEIFCSLIISNLISRIVRKVVIEKSNKNIYTYKVNMKMAVYLVRSFFRGEISDGEQLMKELSRHVQPVRPGRRDERNLKAKSFPGFCYRIAA